jgi:N-acetylmuramoyl-L-alanine amidase
VLATCSIAAADTVTVSGTIGGRLQTAEVPILSRGTVNYVSLTDIVAGFGGTVSLQPDGVQVDLSDGHAWLKLNEVSVNSSLDSFELRQPVLREGDAILVAITDVQALMKKAFGANVAQRVNRESDVRTSELGVSIDELTGMDKAEPSADHAPVPRRNEIRLAIVDAGHGGEDAGFTAILGGSGTKEKDITLAVALKLRSALEKRLGLQVRMSRDEDLMLRDAQRVTLANRESGDILISLHAGASRSVTASGIEVYHSPVEVGMDAESIAQSISMALVEATGTPSRGVREARLSIFRDIEMPAVLIELGFLTNQVDAAQIVDEAYQQKIADGIATGLAPFVGAKIAAGAP